jgi:formate hydrogenlyase subunit 4
MIESTVAVFFTAVLQLLLLLTVAPLVSGLIKTLKARLQVRRGPGIVQPYRDLYKLFQKGMVLPDTASWIFSAAPYVVFAATAIAGLMIPMISAKAPLGLFGGVLAVVYLLGLGRFFLALAGLDTGSSFGGLGSSREMTIAALAEPAMMLAVFTVAIGANSTSLSEIARVATSTTWHFLAPAQMLAFAALFLVLIAETGRIPVDNPATHLELTMIHEAMILEYSGPYLGLIEWGASIKQLLLMTLLINAFLPFGLRTMWSLGGVLISLVYLLLKLLALAVSIVLVETTNAKMRFFRVPDLLAMAFTLAALGLVSTFLFCDRHAHSSRSSIRRQDGDPDGGLRPGAADRHGGAALDRDQHPYLRRTIVPARRHRRHHRLLQSRAAHLRGRGGDAVGQGHPGSHRARAPGGPH